MRALDRYRASDASFNPPAPKIARSGRCAGECAPCDSATGARCLQITNSPEPSGLGSRMWSSARAKRERRSTRARAGTRSASPVSPWSENGSNGGDSSWRIGLELKSPHAGPHYRSHSGKCERVAYIARCPHVHGTSRCRCPHRQASRMPRGYYRAPAAGPTISLLQLELGTKKGVALWSTHTRASTVHQAVFEPGAGRVRELRRPSPGSGRHGHRDRTRHLSACSNHPARVSSRESRRGAWTRG